MRAPNPPPPRSLPGNVACHRGRLSLMPYAIYLEAQSGTSAASSPARIPARATSQAPGD
jgi:hypothetical protein